MKRVFKKDKSKDGRNSDDDSPRNSLEGLSPAELKTRLEDEIRVRKEWELKYAELATRFEEITKQLGVERSLSQELKNQLIQLTGQPGVRDKSPSRRFVVSGGREGSPRKTPSERTIVVEERVRPVMKRSESEAPRVSMPSPRSLTKSKAEAKATLEATAKSTPAAAAIPAPAKSVEATEKRSLSPASLRLNLAAVGTAAAPPAEPEKLSGRSATEPEKQIGRSTATTNGPVATSTTPATTNTAGTDSITASTSSSLSSSSESFKASPRRTKNRISADSSSGEEPPAENASTNADNRSPSRRLSSTKIASPDIVNQRITALLVQRNRSSSLGPSSAHPKQLVKTPTHGLLSSSHGSQTNLVQSASSTGIYGARASNNRSLERATSSSPLTSPRQLAASTSGAISPRQNSDKPISPRERSTSDVGVPGSFHASLRNVFVPSNNSSGSKPAAATTTATSTDGSEAIRKKIEARRNYRKRTASEVLALDSEGKATSSTPNLVTPPASGSHAESGSSSPKAPGSPSKGSSPRKNAGVHSEAASGGHVSPGSSTRDPMRRSMPQTVGSPGGVSPSRRVFQQPASAGANGQSAVDQARDFLRHNLDTQWVLNYSDCEFDASLGKGVSSTVYLGKHKGQEVAIKVLRLETKQRDLDDFKKELEVYSQVNDECIVKFYGATLDPKLCILLEYCPNGTLFHYMTDLTKPVTWDLFLRWTREAAQGLMALHSYNPPVVHRDLKSLNLLLTADLRVKVCDFGLSRFVENDSEEKHKTLMTLRGTYAYVAPEVYQKKGYTSKADVYSMGMVIWEIVYRLLKGRYQRPYGEYPEMTHDFQILMQAARGVRPTIPVGCPRSLAGLIQLCWDVEPNERPSCKELLQALMLVSKDYSINKEEWDALVVKPVIPLKASSSEVATVPTAAE